MSKKSRVFADGALIGLVDDPRELVATIRAMRRQGTIPSEVNVSHKEYNGDVVILTDRGRARRPLIVLKNGEPLITDEDLAKLASGNFLRVLRGVEAAAARLQATRSPSTATIEALDGAPAAGGPAR